MSPVSDIQELNRTHSLFHKAFDQVKARRFYFVSLLFSGLLISLVIWFSHTLSIQHTEDVVDKALKQALTVFALDRGLDAAISVLSSTTVGVGVNVNMGALLDPIDSIIEDFATVLQWAIGALVLQKLLLNITFNPNFHVLDVCIWISTMDCSINQTLSICSAFSKNIFIIDYNQAFYSHDCSCNPLR